MDQGRSVRGAYRNGIARREQIVVKAAEVFAAFGYHGGSLRQIALAVGVTPAALGRHFASKEDLLVEVMEWWLDQTDALIRGESSGLEFFRSLRTLLQYHLDHKGLLELFFTLATESSNPAHPASAFMRARYDTTMAWFADEIGIAVDSGEIPPMRRAVAEREARAVIALLDGFEIQWLLNDSIDLVGLYDANIARLIAGWRSGAID